MDFDVNIHCDNAAFCEDDGTESGDARWAEVARILRRLADQVEEGYTSCYLIDANGNHVGYAQFTDA